jgi:S1-C subfamily serine protease
MALHEPDTTPPATAQEPVPAPRREKAAWGLNRFAAAGLLIAALALVASVLPVGGPQPQLMHTQARAPEPVAPEGVLADVYDESLPATVRIEARCENDPRASTLGVGTGFYVDGGGGLLTAYHVVEGGAGAPCPVIYTAIEADGDTYPLELKGFDAYFDLAFMQTVGLEGPSPYLPLASEAPQPGEGVVAIGNSRGDTLQPRAGQVTRLGVRAGRADFADGTVELTAALAPGDSGGPVLNEQGRVIGVVSYISFRPDNLESDAYVPPFLRGLPLPSEFASYAVPVQEGGERYLALRAGEQRDVPVIGFSWRPGFDYAPTAGDVSLGLRPGPIVLRVQPGGPADEAGLRSYEEEPRYDASGNLMEVEREADVIVAVDGVETPTFYDLLAEVRTKTIGKPVELTVQRGRATQRIDLVLGAKRDVFAGR